MTVEHFYVATKLNLPDENEFTTRLSAFVKLAMAKLFFVISLSSYNLIIIIEKGLKILTICIKFYRNKNVSARGLGQNLVSVLLEKM